jgi:thiol-disulfide isomerase/thioredoxin
MRGRCIGCVLAAVLLLAACGQVKRGTGNVGEMAPAYGTVSLAGDSVSLDQLRGNVVLLNVWATWCEPCRQEIPAL